MKETFVVVVVVVVVNVVVFVVNVVCFWCWCCCEQKVCLLIKREKKGHKIKQINK